MTSASLLQSNGAHLTCDKFHRHTAHPSNSLLRRTDFVTQVLVINGIARKARFWSLVNADT